MPSFSFLVVVIRPCGTGVLVLSLKKLGDVPHKGSWKVACFLPQAGFMVLQTG